VTEEPLFRMEGISKGYGGVRALEQAELTVHAGRVHAILGENGAGKSTLIKVMSGVVQPDEGRMWLDGRQIAFDGPAAANAAGIVCIFQELSLVPDLSVADNIVISHPPTRFGMIDRKAQRAIAEEALKRAGGGDIHPMELVKDLPLSRRQIVEIAKALARKPRLLILDEATSALTAADVRTVFGVLRRLRREGIALVYISHRMHEIAELADDCTVFRNGRKIATFAAGTRSDNDVIKMMIGRDYSHVFPPKPDAVTDAAPVLELRDLSWNNRVNRVSLTVRPGEVVGLGGLDGQGQRELLLAMFGVLRGVEGQMLIDGKQCRFESPAAAKAQSMGMALIPEDRKTEGLMLPMSVRDNLSFAAMSRLARGGIVDHAKESAAISRVVDLLAIRSDGLRGPVSALSGGNQQKVVIAKWLMVDPRIILLNDPTRGIDVGTKQEIYQLLRRLAADGAAIILYSTDYDELIGCCDKVLVMFDGAVRRVLTGGEITEHALIAGALDIEADETGPVLEGTA
jgi:ribose transport system ATP-binding protein